MSPADFVNVRPQIVGVELYDLVGGMFARRFQAGQPLAPGSPAATVLLLLGGVLWVLVSLVIVSVANLLTSWSGSGFLF